MSRIKDYLFEEGNDIFEVDDLPENEDVFTEAEMEDLMYAIETEDYQAQSLLLQPFTGEGN